MKGGAGYKFKQAKKGVRFVGRGTYKAGQLWENYLVQEEKDVNRSAVINCILYDVQEGGCFTARISFACVGNEHGP